MNKIIKVLLALLVLLTLLKAPALASDFTVTCAQEGPCTTTFSSPPNISELFFEENILPGYSVTRTITFINQDPTYDCPLIMDITGFTQTPEDFATKLLTNIRDQSTGIYLYGEWGETLDDLYHDGTVSLNDIPASGTKYFDWTITFDPLTGNDYQGAETVFDFSLTFSCGAPESSPTPTPTPSPSPGGGDGDGDTGGGDTTTTTTTAFAPLTFPDVGAFIGGVLGITAEEEPSPSPEAEVAGVEEKAPEVKGEAVCEWWDYLWWLPLVIQGLLTYLYYYWLKDKQVVAWWGLPLILAGLSQIIHEILGCECIKSRWCPWYWLFNLLILIGLTIYYTQRRKKQSSDLTEE